MGLFHHGKKDKLKGNLNISLQQWVWVHPFENTQYVSDLYYRNLAQRIVGILQEYGLDRLYSGDYLCRLAMSLTAYFEDVVSELGIFRAFITQYRQIYKNEFPWFKIEEEYLEDEVNYVDVRLVMWLTMFALDVENVPNPVAPGIEEMSRQVYQLFLEEFEKAPVNQALVNDIYNEENIRDARRLLQIFVWLGSSCYLLPIVCNCRIILQRSLDNINQVFCPRKKDQDLIDLVDFYK